MTKINPNRKLNQIKRKINKPNGNPKFPSMLDDGSYADSPLNIGWDLENVPLPTRKKRGRFVVHPRIVKAKMTKVLREHGYGGKVTMTAVHGSASTVSPKLIQGLKSTSGVHYLKHPSTDKQIADVKLITLLKRWKNIQKRRGVLVLITGDSDFSNMLEEFNRSCYKTIVVYHPGNEQKEFIAQGNHKFTIEDFVA